ncbi:MAG: IS5 family transposase, partial [Jiangellaceae bacterium]
MTNAPQPSSAAPATRRNTNLEPSSDHADGRVVNTDHHASTQVSDAGTGRAEDNGRKRHVVVDTMGLLLLVVITSASVQDRDGARTLLDRLTMAMPSPSLLWGDGGYAGKLVDWAEAVAHITVEIVRKPLGIKMFQVLPRRWVVERTFAWIVKCRRLDHDYERLPETSEAMIKWAMIGLMVRRL